MGLFDNFYDTVFNGGRGQAANNFDATFGGTRTGAAIKAGGGDLSNPNTWTPAVVGLRQNGGGGGGIPDYSGEIAASNAAIRALQAQLAAQPRILPFDYTASQANARQQASNAVTPIYQKKLNDFLSQARTNEQRQTEDFNTANKQIDEALKNTSEANLLSGVRTSQDVATNVAQSQNQEQQFQHDTGLSFDKARSTLAGGVSAAGLTTSGLGAQQVGEQQTARNTQEARQVEKFNVYRQAQGLFKTRTIEDLTKSNELAGTSATEGHKSAKLSLDRYIQDYGTQEGHLGTQIQGGIDQNALERETAILQSQQKYYGDILNSFLASQKGARGQDLALTRQVYGI